MTTVTLTINGVEETREIEDRTLLVHLIRDHLGLTGTHVGCDTTHCGACTVIVDGLAVKSCTILAASATGSEITTIEGLADGEQLHPVQEAFRECHGLQCGFCTPCMIMAAVNLIDRHDGVLDEQLVRHEMEGNICRCTGYHNIVQAVLKAAGEHRGQPSAVASS